MKLTELAKYFADHVEDAEACGDKGGSGRDLEVADALKRCAELVELMLLQADTALEDPYSVIDEWLALAVKCAEE